MSYYKSIMTGKNKKKIIKEQPKPKKTVLDGIKQELNEWTYNPPTEKRWSGAYSAKDGLTEFEQQGGKDVIKEVGASVQLNKYVKAIDKDFDSLVNNVRELKNLLMKTGARREATELQNVFAKGVGQFRKFMKVKFLRMIDKLI